MSYRRQITRGRRGLGDSQSGSMWEYLTQNSAGDLLHNALYGKLSEEQEAKAVSSCATDNYRAGGGRISMVVAQAQCDQDIRKVVDLNNHETDVSHLGTALLVGAVFVGGLLLLRR